MNAEAIAVLPKGKRNLSKNIIRSMSLKSGEGVRALKSVNSEADEFSAWLAEAREWAKSAGYRESDVGDIIKEVRARKRNESSN